MAHKYYETVVCFIQDHGKYAWQRQLANTYTLGTAIILPLTTLVLVAALLIADSTYAARTLPFFVIATGLGEILWLFTKRGVVAFSGIYLVLLHLILSFGIIWSVGIGVGSMVLCSGAILFAGMLCGYWCALVPAKISTVFMLAFRAAELHDLVHPAYVMSPKPTNFSAVVLLALLFHLLSAIGGSLYRLEETRRELREAETNFAHQKNRLTNKIKLQSQKLQSAEAEKTRQLYRLAEVGEVSTALMHDLANNLTSLAMEIDGIEAKASSPSVHRAKKQLQQISSALNRTRQQLKGEYHPQIFDLAKETDHTIKLLQTQAHKAGISLAWTKPRHGRFDASGEKVLFGQLLTNVIRNAIESYRTPTSSHQSKVAISLKVRRSKTLLIVTDWGKGIAPADAERIFEPFYTTKEGGMGMGLYLTKRFVEGSFGGTIELETSSGSTSFTISLPKPS
jgi:signal transduction histidine kinase